MSVSERMGRNRTKLYSRFKRMFSYYLNACAGAFRARDIQLWQILWSPEGVSGGSEFRVNSSRENKTLPQLFNKK